MGHCFDASEHEDVEPNPDTFTDPSNFQLEDFLLFFILEMANFSAITMTRRGTVHFVDRLAPWFLVTQDDLGAGRITIVESKENGQVRETFRRRLYNMFPVFSGIVRFCT
jgi:hypothetical protein